MKIIDMTNKMVIAHPGFFGRKRDEIIINLNQKFGKHGWELAWEWGDLYLDNAAAIQLYEDAYFEIMKYAHYPDIDLKDLKIGNHEFSVNGLLVKEKIRWLVENAKDVYDNAETNVNSGFDYSIQESYSNHLQDITIRRVLLRLGIKLRGTKLVQVRAKDTEGSFFSPYNIPFHIYDLVQKDIRPDNMPDWIRKGSVEDFYQRNKVIVV